MIHSKRKEIVFHNRVLDFIEDCTENFKVDLGFNLALLQRGHKLSMPISRAMPAVCPGVEELRLRDKSGIYRIFYFAKNRDKVFVFHIFKKKTQKQEIDLARKRLKDIYYETK